MAEPPPRSADAPLSVRSILRVVVIVVVSGLALYLLYLLREPIGWIALAGFIAIAASGPISVLSRHMKRGYAIAVVYLAIIFAPIVIALILIPPLISGAVNVVGNLPEYVQDLEAQLENSERFNDLNEKYDVTAKLGEQADKLVSKLGSAAGALADLGSGLISSIFALVTILVLAMFMSAGGRGWLEAGARWLAPDEADALGRVFDRVGGAVGGYLIGALLQATVAGAVTFLVLWILGVPSPLALAVMVALFDLIPMVGATIGAVFVGVVTLFADFPIVTIIWALFAIAYQQFENYVVQPQIQKRTVSLEPIITLVAVLFGGTLLGVLGAVIAIPVAATIKVSIEEWRAYRRGRPALAAAAPGSSPEPAV